MKTITLTGVILLLLTLTAQAQLEWEEYILTSNYNDVASVGSGDVNSDGDLDIVAVARTSGQIGWWENDGDNNFDEHSVATLAGAFCVAVHDIDGDGQNDIIVGSLEGDILNWYSGSGDTWTQHTIATNIDGVSQIRVHDFNGDTLPDIAVNLYYASTVVVYYQQDDGSWQQTVLATGFGYCNDLEIADMDGDNDMDVISHSYTINLVAWWPNEGASFGAQQTISDSFENPWALDVIDMNGDELLDVVTLSYSQGSLVWFDQGNNWQMNQIASGLSSPRDVEAADLDLDGDIDVYVAAGGNAEVRCYENDDDTYVMHVLRSGITNVWRLHAADIDDDGDDDCVAAGYGVGEVDFYELLGTPVPPLVDIDMIPQQTTIPPNGGQVLFGADLINNTQIVLSGQAWSKVTLPNGQVFEPLVLVPVTMPPGVISVFNLSQTIPGLAPAGTYVYSGMIGLYNQGIVAAEDSFTFTKLGTEPSSITDWSASEWVIPDGSTQIASDPLATSPSEYELAPVYPNPFNAAATVTVTLPTTADLTITLVNTTGQQVAELASGSYGPGQHQFSLDASNLASGLYFVRAYVPGELDQTRKVMLVR